MVFKTIGNPIRKGGGATNEVGLIPTDHAAKGRIHISNTPIHIKHTHARRHGVFQDRKSTRLNSSHVAISYAVFCLKKKNGPSPAVYAPMQPCCTPAG